MIRVLPCGGQSWRGPALSSAQWNAGKTNRFRDANQLRRVRSNRVSGGPTLSGLCSALAGGVGYVAGTLFGVLILGTIQTLIDFDGSLSSWWTRIVISALLFTFCLLQRVFETGRDRAP